MSDLLRKLNRQQWLRIFALGVSISLALQIIVIPIVRWAADQLLLAGENPIVSVPSAIRLVEQRPFVALGIIILLLLITLIVDLFSIIWVFGVHFISREIGARKYLPNLGKILVKRWPSAYWPALVMLLAFLPIFSLCFRSPILVAGRVPIIFLDYVTRNKIVFTLAVIIYVVVLSLAWRFKRSLDLIVNHDQSLHQAIFQLRQGTGSHYHDLRNLLIMTAVSWLINGITLLVLGMVKQQELAESIALIIINTVAIMCLMIVLVNWQLADKVTAKKQQSMSAIPVILLALWLALVTFNDYRYVKTSVQPRHVELISHRGVVDHNGVQNTIPVMQKTHRQYHPDMVEIDIHETSDHQWVVMHDENYQKLTGVNKLPRQLTLKQATKLVARENGYQAPVASFDQYLAAAEKAHQRLLVEVKTTGHESSDYLEQFNRRYANRLLHDHDLVQSMDYDLVKKETKLEPGLKPVYIQAYDVGGPSNTVGGINIEYSGINQHFVWQSHHQHQVLYGWTVNNEHVANQLSRQGVDGIVTDRLPQMQAAIKQSHYHRQSLWQLWAIINPLSDWMNWQNLASK